MIWINYDFVILAQKQNINMFGGIHGIKDDNAIHSCIETPLTTFDNIELYPTIEEKIVQCFYMFCKNHCFNDGNKRISIAVLLFLLRKNDINIRFTQEELIEIGLGVADGSIKKEFVLNIIKQKV